MRLAARCGWSEQLAPPFRSLLKFASCRNLEPSFDLVGYPPSKREDVPAANRGSPRQEGAMTVIAMTREMATLGKDVAAGLSERLGLTVVHHELVEHEIAERAGVRESE